MADPFFVNGDGAKGIGTLRGEVFQPVLAGSLQEGGGNVALGRCDEHIRHKPLLFDTAAVTSSRLQANARYAKVERADIGGIGEVQPHDLTLPGLQGVAGLPFDRHDVAKPAHCRLIRLCPTERSDLIIVEENVIHHNGNVPIYTRPAGRLPRGNDDVAVEPQFLSIILTNARDTKGP